MINGEAMIKGHEYYTGGARALALGSDNNHKPQGVERMTEITVDLDVKCESCGGDLDAEFHKGSLVVETCDTCMTERYEQGGISGRYNPD